MSAFAFAVKIKRRKNETLCQQCGNRHWLIARVRFCADVRASRFSVFTIIRLNWNASQLSLTKRGRGTQRVEHGPTQSSAPNDLNESGCE
jgi:hypothetical protein